MKNPIKLMCCIAAVAVVMFAACKKEDPVTNAKDGLVGSWKMSDVIIDSNDNNVKDPDEHLAVGTFDTASINLKNDGTGDIDNTSLSWTMVDAGHFKISFTNGLGELDTLNANIVSATQFDLVVPPTPPDHPAWVIFKKK